MTIGKIFHGMSLLAIFIGIFYVSIIMVSNIVTQDVQNPSERSVQMIGIHPTVRATVKEKSSDPKFFSDQKIMQLSEKVSKPKRLEDVIDLDKYRRETVVATGYTAGIESTGKTSEHPAYGITYSGVDVKRDLYSTIAADLDVYPIGTIMYIPDYGYGVVADKGSAITGHKIDLYYPTVEDVYALWGKKELDVYIIQMGEGSLTENELTQLNEDETLQVFRDQIIH